MADFVEGYDRAQSSLLPECLDDWVDESNPVRAIDAFVEKLDLRKMGFDGLDPAGIGRPAYHPKIHPPPAAIIDAARCWYASKRNSDP